MAVSSMTQSRNWQGPVLFSYGFRPFFLMAALWACLAMGLWLVMLWGWIALPIRITPANWHAHEFLFGYTSAVIAGFLLTAVPNWTGRLPVVGWRLIGLTALWLLGRVAMGVAGYLPAWMPAAVTLAFPLVLGAMILREILAGQNWRNLPVLALLAVFGAAELVFHIENAGGAPTSGLGIRIGLAAVIGMIAMIGGRIVPSFTRNWLVKQGQSALPAPPMQRFDKAVLVLSVVALAVWVAAPHSALAAVLLVVFAVLHTLRLARWQSLATRPEPLLWVLHLAYVLLSLGAALMGWAVWRPDVIDPVAAQHVWMAGVIGLMTLAVMTRATRGHTGRALHADLPTVVIYLALLGSVAARVLAAWLPGMMGYGASATLWILAFGLFAINYGPYLAGPKEGKRE